MTRKEEGLGWDGFILQRHVTNKPRDPGCHADVGRPSVDHAHRLWTLFEDENNSLSGV
jgi:hypothetical protein